MDHLSRASCKVTPSLCHSSLLLKAELKFFIKQHSADGNVYTWCISPLGNLRGCTALRMSLALSSITRSKWESYEGTLPGDEAVKLYTLPRGMENSPSTQRARGISGQPWKQQQCPPHLQQNDFTIRDSSSTPHRTLFDKRKAHPLPDCHWVDSLSWEAEELLFPDPRNPVWLLDIHREPCHWGLGVNGSPAQEHWGETRKLQLVTAQWGHKQSCTPAEFHGSCGSVQ